MKEIRWELILMPLVSIVLGIYLIMQPGAATVALCSLIGWLILLAGAAGAVNSVTFQRTTFMTSPLLPVSVAGIMVGLFFITRPYTLVEIVGLIICVFLMIQGMTSIQTAVNRKRWGDTLWWGAADHRHCLCAAGCIRPVCAGRFHRADDAHCRYHAGIQRRG